MRSALRRRWFEHELARTRLAPAPGRLEDIGTAYGGWTLPVQAIGEGWTCYCVGAGGDIAFDIELVRRFGARVRTVEAVEAMVREAEQQAAGLAGLTVHHAAIATRDGPIRMQRSHDPQSRSVSAAHLYEGEQYVELPGMTLTSLMESLGDERIDLLKLDIEGAEYDLLSSLDLAGLGVKIFSTQLHHVGGVRRARALVKELEARGYVPVACRPVVKLTFVRRQPLPGAPLPQ
jgi:FkbM family methyltransferase